MRKIIYILFLILCFDNLSFGQADRTTNGMRNGFNIEKPRGKQQKRLVKFIREQQNDAVLTDTVIPGKWQGESAVILAEKKGYLLQGAANGYYNFYTYHITRIKLMDAASVEGYSTFYYWYTAFLEISVEKPNGSKYTVDSKNAIKIETKSNANHNYIKNDRWKLAIPNLEIGDIINIEVADMGWNYKFDGVTDVFDVVTDIIPRAYPVKHYKLEFINFKDVFLNFRAFNTEASLVNLPSSKKGSNRYVFDERMIERRKPEYFSSDVSLPKVKYKLEYVTRAKPSTPVSDSLTLNDIKRLVANKWSYTYAKELTSISEALMKDVTDPAIFVKQFFYLYKDLAFGTEIASGKSPEELGVGSDVILSLANLLQGKNIPFKLILALPREEEGVKTLIHWREIIWGIKLDNYDNIITEITPFTAITDMNYRFYGTEIYTVVPNKDWHKVEIKTDMAIMPEPSVHRDLVTIQITPELDSGSITVNKEVDASGFFRQVYQSDVLVGEDFARSLYRRGLRSRYTKVDLVGLQYYKFLTTPDTEGYREENERLKNALKTASKKAHLKKLKDKISKTYELQNYLDFSVERSGLDPDSNNIVFREKYKLKELLFKSGDIYVLSLGRLYPNNTEIIDNEDKERESDIHFKYPYNRTYKLVVELPEGYQVDNIEQLNQYVGNEVGQFSVKASISGNTLVLDIVKEIKGIHYPKENWNSVLDLLNSSMEFQFKKIVLMKV